MFQPAEDVQEGGLARAARPQHNHKFALLDFHGQVVERVDGVAAHAIRFANVFEKDVAHKMSLFCGLQVFQVAISKIPDPDHLMFFAFRAGWLPIPLFQTAATKSRITCATSLQVWTAVFRIFYGNVRTACSDDFTGPMFTPCWARYWI